VVAAAEATADLAASAAATLAVAAPAEAGRSRHQGLGVRN
jgi:hypothetical protein